MNYTRKSFSVSAPATKTYAENWERTFRGPAEPALVHQVGATNNVTLCGLPLTNEEATPGGLRNVPTLPGEALARALEFR